MFLTQVMKIMTKRNECILIESDCAPVVGVMNDKDGRI